MVTGDVQRKLKSAVNYGKRKEAEFVGEGVRGGTQTREYYT